MGSACGKNGVILNTVQEVIVSFDTKLIASEGDEGEVQPKTGKLKLAGKEVGRKEEIRSRGYGLARV